MATTLKSPSTATAERATGPPQNRSLAMYLVIAGLTVQLTSFVWFLVLAVLTGHATDSMVLPLYVFVAAFIGLTVLALRRPRPWVYLTGGISLVVLCLLYIPFLFRAFFNPSATMPGHPGHRSSSFPPPSSGASPVSSPSGRDAAGNGPRRVAAPGRNWRRRPSPVS